MGIQSLFLNSLPLLGSRLYQGQGVVVQTELAPSLVFGEELRGNAEDTSREASGLSG